MDKMEKTIVLFKPDALHRALVGRIMTRFEQKGLRLVAAKLVQLDDATLEEHYGKYKDKPFFPQLKRYMQSAPVLATVWEGLAAINVVRKLAGATNARQAEPGTIRGDYGMSIQSNLVHAADSPEVAEEEIKRFFKPDELLAWKRVDAGLLYAEDERK